MNSTEENTNEVEAQPHSNLLPDEPSQTLQLKPPYITTTTTINHIPLSLQMPPLLLETDCLASQTTAETDSEDKDELKCKMSNEIEQALEWFASRKGENLQRKLHYATMKRGEGGNEKEKTSLFTWLFKKVSATPSNLQKR